MNKQKNLGEKIIIGFIIVTITISLFAIFYSSKSLFFTKQSNPDINTNEVPNNLMGQKLSRLSLTTFDVEQAKKFMDKDNDGKCDSCGMDVEFCIQSGQLQCNMGSESTIGVLNSQHIHADWKVYINGNVVDFTGKDHMTGMRSGSSVSSFIHVDSGAPAPEKTGDVLHMHATGVPLWIFFESIELKLQDGMKAYVNGKEISDYKNYVFKDLDKILITDGIGDLQQQLNSITYFAKIH